MIKAERKTGGTSVVIECDGLVDMLEELTAVFRAAHDKLTLEVKEEFADHALVYIGQMAYAKTDEDAGRVSSEFLEWLHEDIKQEIL